MGKNLKKAYPLRLDQDLMDKIKVIAKNEDRKISDQLTKIIKEYIKNYENKNGNINIREINQTGNNNSINF